MPVDGLLADDYLDARARLIGATAPPHVTWGQPAGAPSPGTDATGEPGGTSHVVIVDTRGNAVSMTTTVENIFGSGRVVDGFFLNNQLTDFSFSPYASDGTWAANALAPRKRPRSSMAPVIVLKPGGGFLAAMGSPGGANILGYNLKAVLALVGWHLRPQQVAALPNLIAHGDSVVGDALPPAVTQGLAARGVIVAPIGGEASGLQVLMKRPDGSYEGGADPRREGLARGF